MTSHPPCYILLVRSKSLVSAHVQSERITQQHKYQKRDRWGPSQRLSYIHICKCIKMEQTIWVMTSIIMGDDQHNQDRILGHVDRSHHLLIQWLPEHKSSTESRQSYAVYGQEGRRIGQETNGTKQWGKEGQDWLKVIGEGIWSRGQI